MKNIALYITVVYLLLCLGCSSRKDTGLDLRSAGKNEEPKKTSSYDKEELTIRTSDGIELSSNFFYNKDQKANPQPLVILIHQFRQNKEQWNKTDDVDFVDSLVNAGYKVLAYDIRGHGNSTLVTYNLTDLLTNPNEAPNDVRAVFSWAAKQQGIDSTRIAVIGTSIGGNLACFAKYFLGAKAIVNISGNRESYEKFIGIDPRMMGRVFKRITDALFVCGSKDDDIESDEKYVMDQYVGDPKELKVFDSDKHGIALLDQHPEIYTLALNWLKIYL